MNGNLQIYREDYDKIIFRISIFLMIFQSCGIRFFQGIGTILLIIVLFFNISSIMQLYRREKVILLSVISFLFFYMIYSRSFSAGYYQVLLVITPFFFLKKYQMKRGFDKLQSDIVFVLHYIYIHAFCGYLAYLFLGAFFKYVHIEELTYKTFLYLFYVSPGVSLVEGLYRNVGIFWEPGLLQFFLNLYFFLLMISGKCTKVKVVLITINVFFTNSTTGFLLLLINYIYYFSFYQKLALKYLLLGIISIIIISPIIINNIEQKFLGKTQTSGQVRTRDMLIGSLLIYEKPFFGHGYYDMDYLIKNESVNEIDLEVMNEVFVSENGDLSGGYTNGLLDLFIKHGIPFSLLFLFLFYKNKICNTTKSRIFFLLLCIMTFISEPITNTSFFYMILLSSIFINKKPEDETNINCYCNI